ncbi:MAG: 50S ribosomal protein L28 [Firmicutes bacterium]|nr:50S ribosomal protein L28 [Bacillota bacterium]
MCRKGPHSANSVPRRGQRKHVLARSKGVQKPNVQDRHVMIDGQYRRMRLCTRCIRTITPRART